MVEQTAYVFTTKLFCYSMFIEIVAINKALIRLNRLEIAIVIVATGLLKGLNER